MCCEMNLHDPGKFEACQNHPLNECANFDNTPHSTKCEPMKTVMRDESGLKFRGICVPQGIDCTEDESCPHLVLSNDIVLSSYCEYYDNSCKYNL